MSLSWEECEMTGCALQCGLYTVGILGHSVAHSRDLGALQYWGQAGPVLQPLHLTASAWPWPDQRRPYICKIHKKEKDLLQSSSDEMKWPFASNHQLTIYRWSFLSWGSFLIRNRVGGALRTTQAFRLTLSLPAIVSSSSSFLGKRNQVPGLLGLAFIYTVTSFGPRRGRSVGYMFSRMKFREVAYL